MSRFLIFLLLIFSYITNTQAQEAEYRIPISDRYYGKVFLTDASELSSPGWIAIYNKKTEKELIKVESEDLYVYYDKDGIPSINVVELPYGEQSTIIYDDFNFDGIKDFALRDGNNSCYSGPSYQVFLADRKGGFEFNADFTDLAQSYCGFFSVDYDKKRIHTMTKSGCCWHWFYTFDVANNSPRMREKIEEKLDFTVPFLLENTTTQWDTNRKETVKQEDILFLRDNNANVLFSFDLQNKSRTVMLINNDEYLYYIFAKENTRGDSIAEFYYPSNNAPNIDQPLTYNVDNGEETISFANQSAKYEIYNTRDKVGIRVTTNGKVYDMPGKPASRNVTYFFDKLEGVGFDNLNFDADTRLDSITK